jgi:hypothetical protein
VPLRVTAGSLLRPGSMIVTPDETATLTTTAGVSFDTGGTYGTWSWGPNREQSDHLFSTGVLDLTYATLDFEGVYVGPEGTSVELIHSSGGITGHFNDLPDGAIFEYCYHVIRINYVSDSSDTDSPKVTKVTLTSMGLDPEGLLIMMPLLGVPMIPVGVVAISNLGRADSASTVQVSAAADLGGKVLVTPVAPPVRATPIADAVHTMESGAPVIAAALAAEPLPGVAYSGPPAVQSYVGFAGPALQESAPAPQGQIVAALPSSGLSDLGTRRETEPAKTAIPRSVVSKPDGQLDVAVDDLAQPIAFDSADVVTRWA